MFVLGVVPPRTVFVRLGPTAQIGLDSIQIRTSALWPRVARIGAGIFRTVRLGRMWYESVSDESSRFVRVAGASPMLYVVRIGAGIFGTAESQS